MEQQIKELTLLLLYLTSWKEKEFGQEYIRSWKGYPFDLLDLLTEEGYITGSTRSKSVYFSEDGIKKAEELVQKYLGSTRE